MPQLGAGGCIPKPKKDNPASSKIAAAKLLQVITINAEVQFGKICRNKILKLLKPKTCAAITNSFCLMLNTCPRMMRATSTHIVNPMARNTCQKPFPSAKFKAITTSNVGKAQITFMNQPKIVSSKPTKITGYCTDKYSYQQR